MNLQEILQNTHNKKRILENYYNSLPDNLNLFFAKDNIYILTNEKILTKSIKRQNNDSFRNGYNLHLLRRKRKDYKYKNKEIFIIYETYLLVSKYEEEDCFINTKIARTVTDKNVKTKTYFYTVLDLKNIENNFEKDLIVNNYNDKAVLDLEDKELEGKVPNSLLYKNKKKGKLDLRDQEEKKEILPKLIRFKNLNME